MVRFSCVMVLMTSLVSILTPAIAQDGKTPPEPPRYEGVSHITAMVAYKGGVLVAFSNIGGKNPNLHRVHWSADGKNLGAGEVVYEGNSPVTAMVAYKGGVLVAFSNIGGKNPNLHRVHWSADGKNLGAGEVVYEGNSPVTTMVAYKGGVLVAFSNIGGKNPNLHRVHWSADGKNLGAGEVVYEGNSPVTTMVAYKGGVLVAFSNIGGKNPNLHRVHWSADGKNLGAGEVVYEGNSPVTTMVAYKGGVLTAFSNAGGPLLHRIYWSENGKAIGSGLLRYEGSSPITAMAGYKEGVLAAFSNAGGPLLHRIHWSPDGDNLGGNPVDRKAEMEFTFEKLRPLLPGERYQRRVGKGDDEVELTLLRPETAVVTPIKQSQPIEATEDGVLVYGYWDQLNTQRHGHFQAKLFIEVRQGKVVLSRIEILYADCTDTIAQFFGNIKGRMQKDADKALNDLQAEIDEKLTTWIKENQVFAQFAKDISVRFKPGSVILTMHFAK